MFVAVRLNGLRPVQFLASVPEFTWTRRPMRVFTASNIEAVVAEATRRGLSELDYEVQPLRLHASLRPTARAARRSRRDIMPVTLQETATESGSDVLLTPVGTFGESTGTRTRTVGYVAEAQRAPRNAYRLAMNAHVEAIQTQLTRMRAELQVQMRAMYGGEPILQTAVAVDDDEHITAHVTALERHLAGLRMAVAILGERHDAPRVRHQPCCTCSLCQMASRP